MYIFLDILFKFFWNYNNKYWNKSNNNYKYDNYNEYNNNNKANSIKNV